MTTILATSATSSAEDPANVSVQLRELKQALESQQMEIQDLRQELKERDATLDEISARTEKVVARSASEPQAEKAFKLSGGGFIESAAIYRSRNENADVGSTYGNVPFDGTANAHLSEFRGSARQSRLWLLGEGIWDTTHLSAYYETDFLGAAPTANEVESNSWNLRARQLFARVALDNGFSITTGQAWSLLTTNRHGMVPRQEMIPSTIDVQYVVGYNWARQWQARFTQDFGNGFWLGFSVENPETVLNASNPPANVFGFNTSPNAQSPNSLFTLSNTPGANGISTDTAPDLIGKLVYEPGYGHYELKALLRFFRDRWSDDTRYATGLGVGAAAILPLTERIDFILEALGGQGIGRYASGGGPDVTIASNGSIDPVNSVSAMAGLEAHPNDRLDLYLYGGLEYYGRAAHHDAAGNGVGYGSDLVDNSGCEEEIAGICQAQNRLLWQVQPGFWYRFYQGPAGTVQLGASYSFTHRSTWRGRNGVEPVGNNNIVISSFRYYLP